MSHYKPYLAYRPSGVEWIGDVPSTWEVKRLRQVASFTNSGIDKKSYEDQEQVSLCNYTDVYYNEFITADMPFMQATASKDEIAQFTLKKGDLIITKDSEDPSDIGIRLEWFAAITSRSFAVLSLLPLASFTVFCNRHQPTHTFTSSRQALPATVLGKMSSVICVFACRQTMRSAESLIASTAKPNASTP